MKKIFYLKLLLIGFLVACKPKEPTRTLSAGSADFTRFVSVGDGHTAGYMDDALFSFGQENSLGTILQRQLTVVGAQEPVLPWMGISNVGINWSGQSRFKLGYKTDCQGNTSLSPVRINASGELEALITSAYNPYAKFTNFGVPGLRTIDLASTLLGDPNNVNYNPFFGRISLNQLTAPGSGSWSSFQENVFDGGFPTFCSIYIGIEDVLPFAKNGAALHPMSPIAGPPGLGFEQSLGQFCEQISAQNIKGVIATIPDLTSWPFFTTIPYNGLNLDDEKAASLNQIYNPLGYSFNVGENAFMIEDPNAGMFGVRPAQPGERILLSVPLDSVKCNQMGSVFPFRNEFVLTLAEISEIQTRINEINAIIREKAATYGFALVETQPLFAKLQSGLAFNGVLLSTKFVSGGTFSLDGIHLNPRGNALLANEFIKAINQKFNAKVPLINVLQYNSILFP